MTTPGPLAPPPGYADRLAELKDRIRQARLAARIGKLRPQIAGEPIHYLGPQLSRACRSRMSRPLDDGYLIDAGELSNGYQKHDSYLVAAV